MNPSVKVCNGLYPNIRYSTKAAIKLPIVKTRNILDLDTLDPEAAQDTNNCFPDGLPTSGNSYQCGAEFLIHNGSPKVGLIYIHQVPKQVVSRHVSVRRGLRLGNVGSLDAWT